MNMINKNETNRIPDWLIYLLVFLAVFVPFWILTAPSQESLERIQYENWEPDPLGF